MNYQGFEIKPDFTIWKDDKQRFPAIPCFSVSDAEILIDSYLMSLEIDSFMKRFPSISQYDIKSILNEV